MTVTAAPSFNLHTGNGVSTVFAFGFRVLQAADLQVTVDGAVVTNYSAAGIGDPAGGTITFVSPPANGTAVRLARAMALSRATDYQFTGDLPSDTLNDDQDAPVMMVQQVDAKVGRALKVPEVDASLPVDLPAAATRANKLLAFDSNGQPQAISSVAGTATQLALDLLSSIGASLVGFIQSGAGAVARTAQDKARETYTPQDFTAATITDGATDARAALAAADTAAAGRPITLTAGTYRVNTNITLTAGLVFAPGAKLRPAAAVTITLNGPILAADAQVFDLSLGGTIILGLAACDEIPAAWFGARADTTSGSDATNATALQAALNAARNFPTEDRQGVVVLGPGVFRFSTGLTRRAGTLIRGAGRGATVLRPVLASGYGLSSANDSLGGGFRGLTIDGSAATGSAAALSLSTCINLEFDQFSIEGFATSNPAIRIEGACYGLRFRDFWIRNNNRHLIVATGAGANDFTVKCTFEDGEFAGAASSASAAAIQLQDAYSWEFVRCIFQSNATITTILIDRTGATKNTPAMGHVFRDCYTEDNGGAQAGSRFLYMLSNIGTGTPAKGLVVDSLRVAMSAANYPTNIVELNTTEGAIVVNTLSWVSTGKLVLDSGNNKHYRVHNPGSLMPSDLEGDLRVQVAIPDANTTLALDDARAEIIEITGTLTVTRNVVLPHWKTRDWLVYNATAGGQAIQVIGPSGTGITIANNKHARVYSNGTNFVRSMADT